MFSMATPEGQSRARLQRNACAAMDVVMQHPAISTNQQILLSIPTVCRAWRAAAQQASSRALNVQLQLSEDWPIVEDGSGGQCPRAGIMQLAGFASWLISYAGLVHSITINSEGSCWCRYNHLQPLCKYVAGPMLVHSLQAATSQPIAAVQQRRLLRLQSCTSDMLHSSAVLRALSGTGVTCLNLTHGSVPSIAAALPHLPSLRSLHLKWYEVTDVGELMPALGQHSGLTDLSMNNVEAFHPQQLPVQLLQLQVHSVTESRQVIPANLGHLTCLTRLVLRIEGRHDARFSRLYIGYVLPPQLRELQVHTPTYLPGWSAVQDLDIRNLHQLKKLTLTDSQETTDDLLGLQGIACLQHLALSYNLNMREDHGFAAVSGVWPRLQQLQSIEIGSGGFTASTFRVVLHNLTAVTSLTELTLEIEVYPDEQPAEQQAEQQVIAFCNVLAKLQNLRELNLWCNHDDDDLRFVSGDAHHLSALTSLTKLSLNVCGECIDDVAVSAIALMLTQLQWLETCVSSPAVLPVVGRLKGLRHLQLSGLRGSENLQSHFLGQLEHLTYVDLL